MLYECFKNTEAVALSQKAVINKKLFVVPGNRAKAFFKVDALSGKRISSVKLHSSI